MRSAAAAATGGAPARGAPARCRPAWGTTRGRMRLLLLLLLQPPALGLEPVPEWAGLEAVAPQRTEDGSTMQSPLQAEGGGLKQQE